MISFSTNTVINWILIFAALSVSIGNSKDIKVTDRDSLLSAAENAKAGHHIILSSKGSWRDIKLKIKTSGVTVSAEKIGKVRLEGKSSIDSTGDRVTIDGLIFTNGYIDGDHVVKIRGNHCRVTRCSFIDYNPKKASTRYHWLSLYGYHHRVDHCRFSGQSHSGNAICVVLEGEKVGHHRIDHNYFGPRPKNYENGFEMIRIGDSDTSMTLAKCIVTKNLFESCDGEIELISNKSCGNTFIGNAIYRSAGCLTLRHGNQCIVSNNIIIGEGKKGSGGIRIVGEDHVVKNNHIEGTDGRAEGAISISAGVVNPKLNQHAQVKNLLVEGNQLFDNRGGNFCLGHGMGSKDRTLAPVKLTIRNNREKPFPPERVAHPLTKHDVGPDSVTTPHPDAVASTHAIGEVDNLENTAWTIPSTKSINGIVLDETQAELKGDWQYSTHTPPWVGYGYLHDQKKGKGQKSVTWKFAAPKSGIYRVEISHCYNVRRATNTPVSITHADGQQTFRINQQETPPTRRLFRPLGEFRFEKGKPGIVTISNDGTDPKKVVIADAVRFVPL